MEVYDLSVIIPLFNEEFRLTITFNEIYTFSRETNLNIEYIFVNDGSTDKSESLISNFVLNHSELSSKIVSYNQNSGKGYAFRKGVEAASGRLILLSDADFSTPLKELEPMILKAHEGYDFVYGVRKSGHVSLHRKLISTIFSKLRSLLLPQLKEVTDTQCGFKLLTSRAAKEFCTKGKITGFLFDIELFLFLQRRAFSTTGLHVQWIYVTGSHLLSLKNIGKTVIDLVHLIAINHKEKAGIDRALSVQSIERSQRCQS